MTSTRTGTQIDPHWEKLQALFLRAIDLPQDQRHAFIAAECEGDERLRNELTDMLAIDTKEAGAVLTDALGAAIDATTRERRNAWIGRTLGSYRVTAVLGQGGTGTVYLAERSDRQYSAVAAIKIVNSAALSGDLATRFRAERQILASLNHPNIARLLDAGETQEGQPYLVMEYVQGQTLDRYCDSKKLDLNARLELFLQICSAVQYAHQNLVVHRDLKPANILVAADGSPKLLDFGIAKLLDAGEAAAALALTRMNDRLLTPEYASPEQILGRPVTTASDVYALGIVLYELLTGLRPYAVPSSASQLELERSICVADPSRPSTAVRRALEHKEQEGHAEIGAIAAARGLTPDRLERRLVGDIDAIVMRALRKEPERRYASVEQLAADVRRYLVREPVLARQGNWLYYSGRFIRRHTFGVSAGTVFMLFMLAFAIAMSIQTRRVAAERDRVAQERAVAQEVSDFMLRVFGASDPFETYGRVVTARELLDQAGKDIRANLNQHPEVRARLLEAIGRAYRRQNQYQLSISFLDDALRIRQTMPTPDYGKTIAVMTELANSQQRAGNLENANLALRQALSLAEIHFGKRSLPYADLLTDLGRNLLQSGHIAQARQRLEESLSINKELRDSRASEIGAVLLVLSDVATWSDDLVTAERLIRESVSIYSENSHPLHPSRVMAELRLAQILLDQNRLQESASMFESVLDSQRKIYGNSSPQVANVLDSLATIRQSQSQFPEAEALALQAFEIAKTSLGEEHHSTGYYHLSLATHLLQSKKLSEAEEHARAALAVYAKALTPDHPHVASAEHILGEVLLRRGRLEEAEKALDSAMNRWIRTKSAAWRSARSANALGDALYRQGRYQEAERYLTDSYRTLASDKTTDRDALAREALDKARERVTRFYTERGRTQELEALMRSTTQARATVSDSQKISAESRALINAR